MDGHEVLAELLALRRGRPMPIVVVSADASPHTIERLLDQGADAYVTKPVELARVLALLDAQLSARLGSDTRARSS